MVTLLPKPAHRELRAAHLLDHRQHLPGLDGLRGVAVLMVLCHHLCPFTGSNPIAAVCATLWLGVDLFFVLSGFLITGVLYDTLRQPGFFRLFYARRALRLMPVYVAVVAVVLAVNAAMGGRPTIWVLPYFLYGANIVRDAGLPLGLVPKLDVSHLWSLAVEEQFYLLWPAAVFLARTRRRILWLCAAGTALSVALRWIATVHPGHFLLGTPYFELPMRLDSLLLGAALAIVLRSERWAVRLHTGLLYAAMGSGAVALLFSFAAARHGSMFATPTVRYGYFAAAVTFAALVGLAARRETWVARAGSQRVLRAFGRYSYGLYLIHLVARNWYLEALAGVQARCTRTAVYDAAGMAIFVGYVLLCLGLAKLSYSTLEQYFLRCKSRFKYSDEVGGAVEMGPARIGSGR